LPENDLRLLKEAARTSGEIACRFFKSAPQVWDKPEDAGPVTEADLAVNTHLQDMLLSARPEYGWLSEETEDTTERLNKSRVFVIDPIDGTRAFIAGRETWAHSIAVVENGVPVTAIVYLPVLKQMFTASIGGGAFLNDQPLIPSANADMASAKILATKPTMQASNWHNNQLPPYEQHFRSSLAYRLALVAEGAFDAMLTLRGTWEWDIAAGVLLVREAGLLATTKRGSDILFNNSKPMVDGVVAAYPALAKDIVHRLSAA